MLDKTYAERAGVDGMKHVMSPPLRDKSNQPVLWTALNNGFIDTVGTDHCPFDAGQKLMGKDAFIEAARPGDTLALEPGATYVGNFTLPATSGDRFITITTRSEEHHV